MDGSRLNAQDGSLDVDYPLTDLALARRLERAEARANAAMVEARAMLQPEVGATWREVAGAYAMFDGPHSPLTQTFGLGMFDPTGPAELEAMEAFFRDAGAPTDHEVCPMIAPDLLALLQQRGYRAIEQSNVMIRPTRVTATAPAGPSVRLVDPAEADSWAAIAGKGWSEESPEIAAFMEDAGRLIARARGTRCFLAEYDGSAIAAATLCLVDDVAIMAGASTIPEGRRRGAQRALFEARLRHAAAEGATLAMVVAQPGSGSQRNAERRGFRTVYTRTKWRLDSTLMRLEEQ